MMKPDLLLLHGALGASSQMKPLAGKLVGNFNVHLTDFSGHGGSPLPEDFGIGRFTEDVAAFIRDRQLRNTHIFGFSMGGYVALKVAEQYPDLVGKIITLGTKFNWNPDTARHEVQYLHPERVMEKVPDFAKMLAARHHPEDWKEVMKRTAQMMAGLGESPLWVPGVNTIGHDVLLMVGEKDHMVSVDETRNVAENLERGVVEVIPGLPHPMEKVDPEILVPLVADFLSEDN